MNDQDTPANQFKIEPIAKSEVDEVLKIDSGIFKDISTLPDLESIENGFTCKDIKTSEIVGYILYDSGTDEIYIDSLGVKHKYRSNGLASMLLKHLLSKYSVNFKLRVEKNDFHDKLVKYYEKFGFRVIAYFGSPNMSTVMKLTRKK